MEVLQLLRGIKNVAAKVGRKMSREKTLRFVIYCAVFCSFYISCVKCATQSNPVDVNSYISTSTIQPRLENVTDSNNNGTSNSNDGHSSPIDVHFGQAFIASLSMILVSELGDKTFFIAAIMAMQHSRLTVFVGALSALSAMTVLSATFGQLIAYIPRVYTFYVSTALFAFFGCKMLYDGYRMAPNESQQELDGIESNLQRKENDLEESAGTSRNKCGVKTPLISNRMRTQKLKNTVSSICRIILQAFSMTFLAEWGDRSQMATVILATSEDIYGVIFGGILGHSICTAIAVIGGRMISQRISVRIVTIAGGILFICFAISACIIGTGSDRESN